MFRRWRMPLKIPLAAEPPNRVRTRRGAPLNEEEGVQKERVSGGGVAKRTGVGGGVWEHSLAFCTSAFSELPGSPGDLGLYLQTLCSHHLQLHIGEQAKRKGSDGDGAGRASLRAHKARGTKMDFEERQRKGERERKRMDWFPWRFLLVGFCFAKF